MNGKGNGVDSMRFAGEQTQRTQVIQFFASHPSVDRGIETEL